MLRFAIVEGAKRLPFKGGSGVCPTCGGDVIAKCGQINEHHWAHLSVDDCDRWSEPIGEWHLSWQDSIQDEFVEVTVGEHRADIRNLAGKVIELQHSSISCEDIAKREAFYGDMVWVFDATDRFPTLLSGDRAFFSLNRTQHIKTCQKPVFLDCGHYLIEVESFTALLDRFSGFGRKRDREWFASQYLAGCMRDGWAWPKVGGSALLADTWPDKQPWRLTAFPSKWRDPVTGDEICVPKATPFIPLTYCWKGHEGHERPVWSDIILHHVDIANGWSVSELEEMKEFLNGTPMILLGSIRVMPAPSKDIRVNATVTTVQRWFDKVQAHVAAGRLPILRSETLSGLLAKARQFEMAHYGQPLHPDPKPKGENEPPLKLLKSEVDRQGELFE